MTNESADLEQLADRALDVIYRFRLRPTRGFEYVNAAVTRVTGYTPEEHYADPDLGFKLVHPEDHAVLAALLQAPPNPAPLVLRWVRRDGTVVWTEQRNTPVYDDAGELVAIEGIAREIDDPTAAPGERVRIFPGLRIEIDAQRVVVDDALASLTPTEFRLLVILTARAGEVFARDEIMQQLWRSVHAGSRHTCETHISTLRRKIERDPRFPERILTVRGRGYMFAGSSPSGDVSPLEAR